MKLMIDSSSGYLILLLEDNNQYKVFTRFGKNDHSETLTDYLEAFLKEEKVDVKDISSIYVSRGPGSYTGIRISGVVAKVLSYVKNIKLYSFSSLDFVGLGGSYKKIIALIEANKEHSYYKVISLDPSFKEESEELFDSNDQIIDEVINKYKDIQVMNYEILVNDQLIISSFKKLEEYKLFKEESNLDYTPNYIRSGI